MAKCNWLVWCVLPGLCCLVSSVLIRQTFHLVPVEYCGNFRRGIRLAVRSKSECLASCVDDCVGISFNEKTKECDARHCKLALQTSHFNKNTSCYLTGNEFCFENVTTAAFILDQTQSSDKCLHVAANQKQMIAFDLGAQHLISRIDFDTYNLQSGQLKVHTVLYHPTDKSIDVFKHSSLCGRTKKTSGKANQQASYAVACNPCPLYGRYGVASVTSTQPASAGDVVVCAINITGCLTAIH